MTDLAMLAERVPPEISVVIPVCNEEENVEQLAREVDVALAGRHDYELLFVDDGSTDGTAAAALRARRSGLRNLRLLRHPMRSGQSAAIATGVRAARAPLIATLDGDGQNDPADLPRLIEMLRTSTSPRLRLVMGNRTTRRDTLLRRLSSRVANRVRGTLLADGTPDTGCGIKVFERAVFLEVPRFDHMHRFMPALFRREGFEVVSVPVNHRERFHGKSKYGLHNRLWIGIVDLLGMIWLSRRASPRMSVAEDAPDA